MDTVNQLKVNSALTHINWGEVLEHSCKNHHIEGLDYICLRRTEGTTIKIYKFSDYVRWPSCEIINPHNHRYHFITKVLKGQVTNTFYERCSRDHEGSFITTQFDWMSPYIGGDGFTKRDFVWLQKTETNIYTAGTLYDSYTCFADQIHTIGSIAPGTVLMLRQYADVVDHDLPTQTFTRDHKQPEFEGLYNHYEEDEIREIVRDLLSEGLFEISGFDVRFK